MPALALTISLFVLSQSALLVKLAQGATALDIGLWRMIMAVPALVLMGGMSGSLSELRRLTRLQVLGLLSCGLCLFLHWWTWFLSVQTTTLANSMVFFAVSPVFTAIGAWFFFREPFTWRHGVALVFCFAGIWLIFREGIGVDPARFRGDVLGLVASVLFSAYVLLGKGIRRGLSNLPFTIVTYGTCGLWFALVLGAQGKLHADFPSTTWIVFGALAVGPTLLGHGLFTYCLQHFNVNLMNILILSEPVLGSLGAYWILGERLTPGVAQGFLTVCAGTLTLFLPGLSKEKPKA